MPMKQQVKMRTGSKIQLPNHNFTPKEPAPGPYSARKPTQFSSSFNRTIFYTFISGGHYVILQDFNNYFDMQDFGNKNVLKKEVSRQ